MIIADIQCSPKYGYIWFPSCLVAAAFIYFYLPEVKGRTLEEIDEMVRLHNRINHGNLLTQTLTVRATPPSSEVFLLQVCWSGSTRAEAQGRRKFGTWGS
jgi:hypothetical protein